MGLLAFAARALPQIFFLRRKIPPAWDLFLRYLSYAFFAVLSLLPFLWPVAALNLKPRRIGRWLWLPL
jgi:branched-subunit amino acid transport protein